MYLLICYYLFCNLFIYNLIIIIVIVYTLLYLKIILSLSLTSHSPSLRPFLRAWRHFLPTWRRQQVADGKLRDLPHLLALFMFLYWGHHPPEKNSVIREYLKNTDPTSIGTGSPRPVAARHVWRQKDEKHVFNQSFGKDLGRQGGEKGSSLAAAQSLWGGTRSVWFRCVDRGVLDV